MTKLSDKIDSLLRESYGLGATYKEFGGDKDQDMLRLEAMRDQIFDLFREEMEDVFDSLVRK